MTDQSSLICDIVCHRIGSRSAQLESSSGKPSSQLREAKRKARQAGESGKCKTRHGETRLGDSAELCDFRAEDGSQPSIIASLLCFGAYRLLLRMSYVAQRRALSSSHSLPAACVL